MRNLPGIAGRLNRRQFAAVLVAATGLAVIVVAVALHSPVIPSLFERGSVGNLNADGIVVEQPPEVPVAAPIDLSSGDTSSPVVGLVSNPAPGPRPDGRSAPPPAGPTTTTTEPAPPPPTTTSTTLPALLPGIPIDGPPVGDG